MTAPTAPLSNPQSLASEGSVNEQVNSNEIWVKVSGILKKLVSDDAYHRWFESAEIVTISETEAILAVASDMHQVWICLLYTSPSPRDKRQSRMPSSA